MVLTKRQLAEEMAARAATAAAGGDMTRNDAHADDTNLVLDNISQRRSGRNPVKASCECRSIRVFPSVLMEGPIMCGVCGEDFV